MDPGTLGLRRIGLALAALMMVSANLSEVSTMAMQRPAEEFEIAAPSVVLDSVSDRFPAFNRSPWGSRGWWCSTHPAELQNCSGGYGRGYQRRTTRSISASRAGSST